MKLFWASKVVRFASPSNSKDLEKFNETLSSDEEHGCKSSGRPGPAEISGRNGQARAGSQ